MPNLKKIGRALLYGFLGLALILSVMIAYIAWALPNVGPPPDIEIALTEERIERGAYLANSVMVCMDCHSQRDWSTWSGPLQDGTLGAGGEVFNEEMGLPGTFISPNITPYALSDWTDGEIYRAITSGVSKDGRALFDIMPHPNFGQCATEDIYSVIAYIRSLEPIEADHAASQAHFPVNLIINTIPKEASPQAIPPKKDKVAYGAYLALASGCKDCHTAREKGQFVGPFYAGGMEFMFPDKTTTRAPNITPHANGIGSLTEDEFVWLFKKYTDSTYVPKSCPPGSYKTPMPWTMYATMTQEDLKAIFAYLQTLEPVDHYVERFTEAQ
jgi:mono/diheme cytochrome c family protein